MKKVISVFAILTVIIMAFAGCNTATTTTSGDSPSAPAGPIDLSKSTIMINIPHKAGSSTDIVARAFQPFFSEALGGATVIIENLEGGGGNKAHSTTFKADPDGLTLEITPFPSIVLGELTKEGDYKSLEYTYLSTITGNDFNAFFVQYDSPINSLEDLIALSKERQVTVAGSGIGTNGHMAMKLTEKAVGTTFEYVSFDGGSEAAVSVAGGHTDAGIGNVVALVQLAQEKKIKVISMVGSSRHPSFPDVPTTSEDGYPEASMDVCVGLIAPPDMDPELVAMLEEAARTAVENPEFIKQATALGSTVIYKDSAEFKTLAEEIYKQAQKVSEDIKALAGN